MLERIGHGVHAVRDPAIVDFLVAKGTGLEICISSNLSLGLFASLKEHPFKKLIEAGVRVCLGTDDPAFFNTSCDNEYKLASLNAELSQARLVDLSRDAIRLAFCDDATKAKLNERLDALHSDGSGESEVVIDTLSTRRSY